MTPTGSTAAEPSAPGQHRGSAPPRRVPGQERIGREHEREAAARRAVPARHRIVMWAGVAAIAAVFTAFLYSLREDPGLDMTVYWRGAQVLHGLNPSADYLYDPSLVEAGRLELPFTYPPAAAVIFYPLGGLSLGQAWMALKVVNGLLLAALCWTCLRLAPFSRGWFHIRPIPTLVGFAATCLIAWQLFPTWFTFTFGQINLLLALLILADFGRRRAGGTGTGFLTGLTAGLKLTPAAMGLVPLVQGRWRSIAGMAAGVVFTIVAAAVVLPREVLDYFTTQVWTTGRVGDDGRISNQSLNGAVHLWGVPESLAGPLWIVAVLATIGLGALGIRRVARSGDQFSATVIGALVMLLISPISWEHHWVWVLPLLLALLPAEPRRAAASEWAIAAALTVLLLVVFQDNPSVMAAEYLGDQNAGVVFNGSPALDRLGTVPVLAAILAGVWVALRPRPLLAQPLPADDDAQAPAR